MLTPTSITCVADERKLLKNFQVYASKHEHKHFPKRVQHINSKLNSKLDPKLKPGYVDSLHQRQERQKKRTQSLQAFQALQALQSLKSAVPTTALTIATTDHKSFINDASASTSTPLSLMSKDCKNNNNNNNRNIYIKTCLLEFLYNDLIAIVMEYSHTIWFEYERSITRILSSSPSVGDGILRNPCAICVSRKNNEIFVVDNPTVGGVPCIVVFHCSNGRFLRNIYPQVEKNKEKADNILFISSFCLVSTHVTPVTSVTPDISVTSEDSNFSNHSDSDFFFDGTNEELILTVSFNYLGPNKLLVVSSFDGKFRRDMMISTPDQMLLSSSSVTCNSKYIYLTYQGATHISKIPIDFGKADVKATKTKSQKQLKYPYLQDNHLKNTSRQILPFPPELVKNYAIRHFLCVQESEANLNDVDGSEDLFIFNIKEDKVHNLNASTGIIRDWFGLSKLQPTDVLVHGNQIIVCSENAERSIVVFDRNNYMNVTSIHHLPCNYQMRHMKGLVEREEKSKKDEAQRHVANKKRSRVLARMLKTKTKFPTVPPEADLQSEKVENKEQNQEQNKKQFEEQFEEQIKEYKEDKEYKEWCEENMHEQPRLKIDMDAFIRKQNKRLLQRHKHDKTCAPRPCSLALSASNELFVLDKACRCITVFV